MTAADIKSRRLSDYPYQLDYRTRWLDNDQYDHLNNSIYYHLFDSVVNAYLIEHCQLVPSTSPYIGLVVHSSCDYLAPVSFPALTLVGMRVRKLGKSSVAYECAVFEKNADGSATLAAVGEFIHVYVDSKTRKPTKEGMPANMRSGLEAIVSTQSKL